MENEKTGYLGSYFVNKTEKGTVMNFFLLRQGHFDDKNEKYTTYEYPFETWFPDLIEKIKNIPRGDVVSIIYSDIPRRKNIGEKKIPMISYKANSIIHWNQSKKEKGDNKGAIQMEIPYPSDFQE